MNFIGKHIKNIYICLAIALASVNIFIRDKEQYELAIDTVNVIALIVAITLALISRTKSKKEDLNENDLTCFTIARDIECHRD